MAEMITADDAQYAFDIVRTICTEVGPGMPGTPQERDRAFRIKKELESHLGAANVAVEDFTVAPWAWLSAYPLSALFMLIAALLNISVGRFAGISPWLTSTAALAFSILSLLTIIFLFVHNHELADRFFKKKPSLNIIGTLHKPGAQNVKRLLILSGHHDSAPENTWLRFLGYGFLIASAIWVIGFIAMLVMSIIQLVGTIAGNAAIVRSGTLGWAMMAFLIVPSIIFGLFFNRGRKSGGNVPGAVDNLSASALTTALCRFLVKNPAIIPDDTEIRFISFGSEEAGVRGSRRYVERHLDELKRLDTRVLNIEMVAHPEIIILATDGIVKNSPEVVSSAAAAAERAGVPYKVESPFFGGAGTDGASFSAAGIKAATLFPFKMPQQMVAFYHQKWDGPEVVTIEPLLNVLKLTLEWIRSGGE